MKLKLNISIDNCQELEIRTGIPELVWAHILLASRRKVGTKRHRHHRNRAKDLLIENGYTGPKANEIVSHWIKIIFEA